MKGFATFLIACVIGVGAIGCGGGGSKSPTPSQPATVTAVNVRATAASLVVGKTLQLSAIATYSDNSTKDVTASSTWQTSDATIAAVSNTGMLSGVKAGGVTVSVTMAAFTGTMPFTINPPTLSSILITPSSAAVAVGQTRQLKATGFYSDNSTQDLTGTVNWSSTNSLVASVSAAGMVTGVAAGQAGIVAASGSVSSAAAPVNVTAVAATLVSIQLTPSSASLNVGQARQFTATGVYSDNSTQNLNGTVIWSSTNQLVASANAYGVVTGASGGQASITAASGSITSPAALVTVVAPAPTLVSIQITPASASLPVGQTQQLKATGYYSDNSSQDLTSTAIWASKSQFTASVSASGLVTAVAVGQAGITAASGSVTSGVASITVSAAPPTLSSIQVTPASAALTVGQKQQLKATGTYSDSSTQDLTNSVTWSSNALMASVSGSGLVTAVSVGQASITALSGSITSGAAVITVSAPPVTLVSIQVTPSLDALTVGQTQQLKAMGVYSDSSTQDLTGSVTWSSTNALMASVSGSGLVTAVGAGQAFITAASGSVSSIAATFTVTAPAPTLSSLVITPLSNTLAMGQTQQLKATGVYSDGSTQDLTSAVTWFSGNQPVATVSSSGMVTAVVTGQAGITAADGSFTSAPATINVTAAALTSIVVGPSAASVATGETQQFTATGLFTDGSAVDISNNVLWASDTPLVATVNPTGLATGLGIGTANISATSGTVVGSNQLTVTAAVLQSIDLSPDVQSIQVGGQVQFTVTGTFSDGSSQLMTNASYSSSNPAIAVIDPVTGIATGVAANANAVTITATLSGFTDTASLTVLAPTLQSIAIAPLTGTVTAGSTLQFALTGVFSDGSTGALTQGVSWSSSSAAIAGIDANGLATGVAPGQATIGAAYGGLTTTATLSVELGAPISITVTPAVLSLGIGGTQQFTATAVFGDGTTQDLTSQVQWVSSAATVALISNSGLANAVGQGTAQITASYEGVSGAATLTVTPVTLVSIKVTPATPEAPAHTQIQFTATGVYSDGSTSPLNGVSWHSSSSHLASISRSGLVWTKRNGSVTISATLNGATGSTVLTVGTSSSLVSLAITPANATIAVGTQQQFTLTGTYGDGTHVDLTKSAFWLSSNWRDVFVWWGGLATAEDSGQVGITAWFGQLTAQTTLTVSNATIQSVSVTPSAPSIALGASQQFTATGTFSDGTTQDITGVAKWTSSNDDVAEMDGHGLADSAGRGSSNVTATFNDVSGTGVLTVN